MSASAICGIPPGTKVANIKNLVILNDRLKKIDELEGVISTRMIDPAYSFTTQKENLKHIKERLVSARNVLYKEKEIREKLKLELTPPEDTIAAKETLQALDKQRKEDYPKFYGKGARVGTPCIRCIEKKINKLTPVLMPKNSEQASEFITGIFEGGRPDYCALADSSTDTGGLSYGKHQASETSGNLLRILKLYSQSTDSSSYIKNHLDEHLDKFSQDGKLYIGTAHERQEFKNLLKNICNDAGM